MVEAALALAALKELESGAVKLLCRNLTLCLHTECHPFPEALSG